MTSFLLLTLGLSMWLIAWAAVALSAANVSEASDHDSLTIDEPQQMDGDDPRLVEAVRRELEQ